MEPLLGLVLVRPAAVVVFMPFVWLSFVVVFFFVPVSSVPASVSARLFGPVCGRIAKFYRKRNFLNLIFKESLNLPEIVDVFLAN